MRRMGLYKSKPTLYEMVAADPTLLESINLPTAIHDTYFNTRLLLECGPLEVIFDTPAALKAVLNSWSKTRQPAWTRIAAALTDSYNPIHNYDRTDTESITITTTGSVTAEGTGTTTGTVSGTTTDSSTGSVTDSGTSTTSNSQATGTTVEGTVTAEDSGTDTTTRDRAGFDSAVDTYAQDTKDAVAYGKTTTTDTDTTTMTDTSGETETTSSGSRSTTSSGSGSTSTESSTSTSTSSTTGSSGSETRSRTLTSSGNIGVTSSQELLEQELEIRMMDGYAFIINDFKREFCVGVW